MLCLLYRESLELVKVFERCLSPDGPYDATALSLDVSCTYGTSELLSQRVKPSLVRVFTLNPYVTFGDLDNASVVYSLHPLVLNGHYPPENNAVILKGVLYSYYFVLEGLYVRVILVVRHDVPHWKACLHQKWGH